MCWCPRGPRRRSPVTRESSTLRLDTRQAHRPRRESAGRRAQPSQESSGLSSDRAGGWHVSRSPRCHWFTWFWFFQEELADGEGHGLCHLYGRPVPAVGLRGHLQPLLPAAAAHADAGPPPGRRGGHHGRDLGPGARWVPGSAVRHGRRPGWGSRSAPWATAQGEVGGATWEQGLSLCSVQFLKARASVQAASASAWWQRLGRKTVAPGGACPPSGQPCSAPWWLK